MTSSKSISKKDSGLRILLRWNLWVFYANSLCIFSYYSTCCWPNTKHTIMLQQCPWFYVQEAQEFFASLINLLLRWHRSRALTSFIAKSRLWQKQLKRNKSRMLNAAIMFDTLSVRSSCSHIFYWRSPVIKYIGYSINNVLTCMHDLHTVLLWHDKMLLKSS